MPRAAGTTAGDTRARIVAVTLDLMSERGYAGVSIRDIAEQLNMTKAALYYHFASKEELLDALVAPVMDRLTQLADIASSGSFDDEGFLTDLVVLMSGPDTLELAALFRDPSAMHLLKERLDPLPVFERIVRGLARSDDPYDVLRARCALGAVNAALFSAVRGGPHAGKLTGLDSGERRVVVGAALGVLRSSAADATSA
jgi:AcrR family transcriptional regulator